MDHGIGTEQKMERKLQYLRYITDNFSSDRKIGEGGFGVVYKGIEVESGAVMAVKRLRPILREQDKQFKNEANHLARVNHHNVVKLIGYCEETKEVPLYDEDQEKYFWAEVREKLLCYEYLSNGSLDSIIFDESLGLDWQSRYKIIIGICQGLQYLHEGLDNTPIIHMDLKPSNILLDDKMEPKIADFGLSRLFSEEQSLTCTKNVMGSIGYMAPEYFHSGEISTKSDIYSLGILILEIITGMKNHQAKGNNLGEHFIQDVRKNWTHISQIASKHPSLEADCLQQVHRCIQIGLCCVEADKERRPSAGQMLSLILCAGGCTHMVDQDPTPQAESIVSKNFDTKSFKEGLNSVINNNLDPLPLIQDLLPLPMVTVDPSANKNTSLSSVEMIWNWKLGIGVVALVLVILNLNNSFSWVGTALTFIITARAASFAIGLGVVLVVLVRYYRQKNLSRSWQRVILLAIGVVLAVALFRLKSSSPWSSAIMTFKLATATALRTSFFTGIVVLLVSILYLHLSSSWQRVIIFAIGVVLAAVLILWNSNSPWSWVVLTLKFVTVLVTSSAIGLGVVVLVLCLLNPTEFWRWVGLFSIGGAVLSAALFLLNPSGSWSWVILTLKFFRFLVIASFALVIVVAVLFLCLQILSSSWEWVILFAIGVVLAAVLILWNSNSPWSWVVLTLKFVTVLVTSSAIGLGVVVLVLSLLNPTDLWRQRVVLFSIGGVVLSAALFLLNPSGSWSWVILTLKFFRFLVIASFALVIVVAVLFLCLQILSSSWEWVILFAIGAVMAVAVVLLLPRIASIPWSWVVITAIKVVVTLVTLFATGIVLVYFVLYLLNLSGSRRLVILSAIGVVLSRVLIQLNPRSPWSWVILNLKLIMATGVLFPVGVLAAYVVLHVLNIESFTLWVVYFLGMNYGLQLLTVPWRSSLKFLSFLGDICRAVLPAVPKITIPPSRWSKSRRMNPA